MGLNISIKSTSGISAFQNLNHTTNESGIDVPIEYQITIPSGNLRIKQVAQKANKNRAETVKTFCKTWKQQGELTKPYLYFDFYHKFLYCAVNKVLFKIKYLFDNWDI
jgi:hypothetical protein